MSDPLPQPQPAETNDSEAPIRRLNWGCGEQPDLGWINSDVKSGPNIDISCNILEGLPLESDSIDYAASIHALPEIPYGDLVPVLKELRRVLKPAGVLRLALPDLERAIKAWQQRNAEYFLVPDADAETIGGKLVTQMVWYGWSRSLFTPDFTDEILRKAGFREVAGCAYRETKSRFPEIVELDSRERESLFVEAVK